MSTLPDNKLLAMLSAEEWMAVRSLLKAQTFKEGTVLDNVNDKSGFVYFPLTCVVSQLQHLGDGISGEVACIGREGAVDVGYLLSVWNPNCSSVVTAGGAAFSADAVTLCERLHELPGLQRLLQRYTLFQMARLQRAVLCGLRHDIRSRVARWLLQQMDKTGERHIVVTQEFLSMLMAVRRQSINWITSVLEREKLIQNHRGLISISDRTGLQRVACECYYREQSLYNRAF